MILNSSTFYRNKQIDDILENADKTYQRNGALFAFTGTATIFVLILYF